MARDTTELLQNTTSHRKVLEPLSLRRNFGWTLCGNVIYSVCQWAMLVLIVKLGTPETVGEFALALAITAPVMTFLGLNLRAVQATDARHEYEFGDYLGVRLLAVLSGLCIITAIASFVTQYSSSRAVILAVGLAKGFESISDVIFGLLQQSERMDRISISQAIKGTSQLAVLSVVLYATRSLIWAVLGLALVNFVTLAVYDLSSAVAILRKDGAGIDVRSLRNVAAPLSRLRLFRTIAFLSLPLGIVGLLDSLNTNIPRYFIEHLQGKAALGYFAALAYIPVAGHTVITALADAARPRLAKYYFQNLRAFNQLLVRLLGVGAGIGLLGVGAAVSCGHLILTVLYTPDYARHLGVLSTLMVAAAFWYLSGFMSTALTAARAFNVQVPLFAGAVLTTIIACAVAIPHFGIAGAAWALCAGMAARFLGSGLVLHQILQKQECRSCSLVLVPKS